MRRAAAYKRKGRKRDYNARSDTHIGELLRQLLPS
jgi:hypothetical protein